MLKKSDIKNGQFTSTENFHKENIVFHKWALEVYLTFLCLQKKTYERKVTNTAVYFQSAISIIFGPSDHKKEINSEVLST